MFRCRVLWGLTFNLPGIIFTASEANPWENLWYSTKLSKNEFVRVFKCILKGYSVPSGSGTGGKKKWWLCSSLISTETSLLSFCVSALHPAKLPQRKKHEQSRFCLIKDILYLQPFLGWRSTVGRLLPACVGRTTLYHLLVWIDSSLYSSLVYVCHRPSQHMFDSDRMFVVRVEPPTQTGEGQLHRIDTYEI